MPPYSPFLVFGTVRNSLNETSQSAIVNITSSLGTISLSTNSAGNFVGDLGSIGYTDGETITVVSVDRFGNETSTDTFVVAGGMYELDITLSIRDDPQVTTTGYTVRSMLHSIGNKPITVENPLAITTQDLLAKYVLAGRDDPNDLYGYMDVDGRWYIMSFDSSTKIQKYARGDSSFEANWANRFNLTYDLFNEVFG